jgi:hypothetical protein
MLPSCEHGRWAEHVLLKIVKDLCVGNWKAVQHKVCFVFFGKTNVENYKQLIAQTIFMHIWHLVGYYNMTPYIYGDILR